MEGSVFIILLNWNGWRDTIECLESLQQLNYLDFRIVLLDNGSTDDSYEKIKRWAKGEDEVESRYINYRSDNKEIAFIHYDRVAAESGGIDSEERKLESLNGARSIVWIDNNDNLGFAAGCNVGIRYALASGADYVWLLNNDTVVEPSSLTYLVNCLKSKKGYRAATCQIRLYDDPNKTWNCGGELTWYGTRKYRYDYKSSASIPQKGEEPVTFVTGCALLIETSLLNEIGILTERFFMGEEDFEFSQRLKKAGVQMACRYDSIIYHKISASFKGTSFPGHTYIYYLCRFINMRFFWPRIVWKLWRICYSPYIIAMLKLRMKMSFRDIWSILLPLFKDSEILDGVDRDIHMQKLRHTVMKKTVNN